MSTRFDVVVLAGGASRRMGHDKALLRVRGRRVVDDVAARMGQVAERVLVASGARPLGRDDEVPDAPDCVGPLAGIIGALAHTRAPLLAVVPVDAPGTTPQLVARLAGICEHSRRPAAVVTADGHLQALHVVLTTAALPAIRARATAGERSPRRLWGWLDALRVDVDGWVDLDPTGRMATDWDRPEDLPPEIRPG